MLSLQKDLDRFWTKINKAGECWLWLGASTNKGYGRFKFEGKLYSPHVIVYCLHNNDYDSTKQICHRCDNPACCNPKHLFIGTRSKNMLDCVSKGRHKISLKRGEDRFNSKLKEVDVVDIKTRLAQGERVCSILLSYNFVNRSTINDIKRNKNWKHIMAA